VMPEITDDAQEQRLFRQVDVLDSHRSASWRREDELLLLYKYICRGEADDFKSICVPGHWPAAVQQRLGDIVPALPAELRHMLGDANAAEAHGLHRSVAALCTSEGRAALAASMEAATPAHVDMEETLRQAEARVMRWQREDAAKVSAPLDTVQRLHGDALVTQPLLDKPAKRNSRKVKWTREQDLHLLAQVAVTGRTINRMMDGDVDGGVNGGTSDAKPATKAAKGYAPGERKWDRAGATDAKPATKVAKGYAPGERRWEHAAKIGATMRAGPGMKISNWSKEEEEAIVGNQAPPK